MRRTPHSYPHPLPPGPALLTPQIASELQTKRPYQHRSLCTGTTPVPRVQSKRPTKLLDNHPTLVPDHLFGNFRLSHPDLSLTESRTLYNNIRQYLNAEAQRSALALLPLVKKQLIPTTGSLDDLIRPLGCERPVYIESTDVCTHGNVPLLELPCLRRWCRPCQKRKRAVVGRRIAWGMALLPDIAFVTLTWHLEDMRTRDKAYVMRCQEAIIKAFRKKYGAWCQYFSVREFTLKGQLHLHWLVSGVRGAPAAARYSRPVDRLQHPAMQWLVRRWQSITSRTGSKLQLRPSQPSFICDIQRPRSSGRLGTYVTKYLTKIFDFKQHPDFMQHRRYSFSRGWPHPPSRPSLRSISPHSMLQYARRQTGRTPVRCEPCEQPLESPLGTWGYKHYPDGRGYPAQRRERHEDFYHPRYKPRAWDLAEILRSAEDAKIMNWKLGLVK